jgi:hypothetical protein
MQRLKWYLSIACVLAAGLLATGCGGSGSSGSTGSASTSSASSTSSTSDSSQSAEAGSKKATPGFGGNELAEYGVESSGEEREAASKVLKENLEARGSGNWAGQCATLAATVVKAIEKEGPAIGGPKGCAAKLGAEAKNVPPYVLADTLGEPIAALRVKGNSAYALYHGNDGKDYAMEMTLEGSVWKVGALTTIPLEPPPKEAPPKEPKSSPGSSEASGNAKS